MSSYIKSKVTASQWKQEKLQVWISCKSKINIFHLGDFTTNLVGSEKKKTFPNQVHKNFEIMEFLTSSLPTTFHMGLATQ